MKKISILFLSIVLLQNLSFSQKELSKEERMKWWREARLGMFIHWGVYAQLEGTYNGHEQRRGGAEWIMNRMKIVMK